ncbi:MAG TPA: hypothetical protein VMU04_10115 [Candidatus Acidoferrum sp.]|nr:hypothetical protein [Candidatus Acidoferrum sp.]
MQDTFINHPSLKRSGFKTFPDYLYVVTAISNPVRYRTRYELYRAFEKRVADAGAILYTVEAAFGDRPFEVTEAGSPRHIQLRTLDELWHKENLLNIGIGRLPREAKYIAWIDADILFTRPDWAQETLHQLQHYHFVQMFSKAVDLGPNYEHLNEALSWTESERQGLPFRGTKETLVDGSQVTVQGKPYVRGAWHSGLAWAATREALDAVGGLIDVAILGSADRNMAAGLFGHMADTIDPTFSPAYKAALLEWEQRAERHIRRDVGQVSGTVLHHWHGKKVNRKYTDRWKILAKYQFDPNTDLKRDAQGLWQFEDAHDLRSIGLRDAVRNYFRERNEDSIEV